MVEIVPVVKDEVRFLGIAVYLPKCTMRMLFNREIMIVDSCFDVKAMEERCSVNIIQCMSGSFEKMFEQTVLCVSKGAMNDGIHPGMSVKEAMECVFSQKEKSEEFF